MDTQEIRRRALINAMHARCGGKQVALAQQLGARADYVSRMLSPGRNAKGIGGDYAREIEQSLGLPPLWLDQPQNAGEHALVPATRANVTSVPVLEHPHHAASSEFWGVPLFAADIERAGYGSDLEVLGGGLFGIVDAYDAMTHDRPYKAVVAKNAALAEISAGQGTQFDPQLANAFLAYMSGSEESQGQ